MVAWTCPSLSAHPPLRRLAHESIPFSAISTASTQPYPASTANDGSSKCVQCMHQRGTAQLPTLNQGDGGGAMGPIAGEQSLDQCRPQLASPRRESLVRAAASGRRRSLSNSIFGLSVAGEQQQKGGFKIKIH